MKNVMIAILLVAAVAFAGLYVSQKHKLGAAEAANAALRQRLSEMEGRVAEQEKRTTRLQTRLQDTRAKAVAKADEVSHLEQALTNSVKTNAKASNPFGEMFKSKEMKELVKTQQKVALGGIIDKNYGALFTGLQLTPEQSAGLKELIVKKSLVDAGVGMSLMTGDVDPSKRGELMQQAKADKDAINEEIKQFLEAALLKNRGSRGCTAIKGHPAGV